METLKETVLTDMKTAMKEKNAAKLEAIRAVKSSIDKFEKEKLADGNEMSSANYATAMSPLVKQRTDSIEQFKASNNENKEELIAKEQAEIDVINSYLEKVKPRQMAKEEMELIIKQYVANNSLGKSDMGKVMSYFKSTYDGLYDGKELSIMVKSILA